MPRQTSTSTKTTKRAAKAVKPVPRKRISKSAPAAEPVVEVAISYQDALFETLRTEIYTDVNEEAPIRRVMRLCEIYGLDPLKKPYVIKYENGLWKIFLAAAAFEMIAFNTGLYAGSYPAEFGLDITLEANGKQQISLPEYAQVTVVRLVNRDNNGKPTFGEFAGPRVYANEYAKNSSHIDNVRMFMQKWAKAVALKEAFRDFIGNVVSAEELAANMQFSNKPVKLTQPKAAKTSVADDIPYTAPIPGSVSEAVLAGKLAPSGLLNGMEHMIESALPTVAQRLATNDELKELFDKNTFPLADRAPSLTPPASTPGGTVGDLPIGEDPHAAEMERLLDSVFG